MSWTLIVSIVCVGMLGVLSGWLVTHDEAKGCLEINDIGQEVTISAVPTQLTGSNAVAIGSEVSK